MARDGPNGTSDSVFQLILCIYLCTMGWRQLKASLFSFSLVWAGDSASLAASCRLSFPASANKLSQKERLSVIGKIGVSHEGQRREHRGAGHPASCSRTRRPGPDVISLPNASRGCSPFPGHRAGLAAQVSCRALTRGAISGRPGVAGERPGAGQRGGAGCRPSWEAGPHPVQSPGAGWAAATAGFPCVNLVPCAVPPRHGRVPIGGLCVCLCIRSAVP